MIVRLYLSKALAYSDHSWFVFWQPWPEDPRIVSAQCQLVVRRYEKLLFLLITSEQFGQKSHKSLDLVWFGFSIPSQTIFPHRPFWTLAVLHFFEKPTFPNHWSDYHQIQFRLDSVDRQNRYRFTYQRLMA